MQGNEGKPQNPQKRADFTQRTPLGADSPSLDPGAQSEPRGATVVYSRYPQRGRLVDIESL